MAQKSIISFFGKTSSSEETNVEASSPQEADIPSSEHSSGPQKKKQKFEHVYQDDKWPEKWPFLTKTEKKHSFLNSHYFFVYPFTFRNESTYMLEGNN